MKIREFFAGEKHRNARSCQRERERGMDLIQCNKWLVVVVERRSGEHLKKVGEETLLAVRLHVVGRAIHDMRGHIGELARGEERSHAAAA